MTKTKVSRNINQRTTEKRKSRLKATKQYLLENSISGLLNNQKWYKLFDWLHIERISFKLKFLVSKEEIKCDWIREVENTSILIDDSGDFIEFLEIESLKIPNKEEIVEFLKTSNIHYIEAPDEIEVRGYNR